MTETTTCCIAGGGPAGLTLGYLLAKQGVPVIVLEKHADFLRDFRGDTIHPSTFELMSELGLLDEILESVDFRASQLFVNFEGQRLAGPTFEHLPTQCPFIGFVPQWDFLNLIARHAVELPTFELRTGTRAVDLMRSGERVIGVHCEHDDQHYEIRADLVVAADGRDSTLRQSSGQIPVETGVPIDVLWFRLDCPEEEDTDTLAWIRDGQMLVTLPRTTHYQVAMVIQKGRFREIQQKGVGRFQETIGNICPGLRQVAQHLKSWDHVKVLTVQINRLEKWYQPGLLLIGDAAHAMSPVGGVGINLAIQDAVAAANRLVLPLRNGNLEPRHLRSVQQRRERATRRTQWLQARVHRLLFGGKQAADRPIQIPWLVRWTLWLAAPFLRPLAGRIIGLGMQPESYIPAAVTPSQPSSEI